MFSQQQRSIAAPARAKGLLPSPFGCSSRREGMRGVRVEASGELDLVTTPVLERALRQAAAAAELVVLDLRSLTFIDSSGVHAIEDASVYALLRGGRLIVSGAPDHVARIMALTGTSSLVELRDLGQPG